MRYKRFIIEHYRAIEDAIAIDLENQSLIPLIGVNECGKTTILQAIFGFDSANDKDYDGRHLENTINLYHTTDTDPLITAEIEVPLNELLDYWETINKPAAPTASQPRPPQPVVSPPPEFPVVAKTYLGSVHVTRNLKSKQYSVAEFSAIDPQLQHRLAKQIVQHSPYILYNDDFQDRPPSTVSIPNPKPVELSDWLAIYERLFEVTNPSYSLFTTALLDDKRRKDSIVSDVQKTLNGTLTKAWRTFHLDRTKQIQVKLDLTKTELQINIVENIGQRERFFEIVDRSKGFLWFYNFVMKLEFNPKNFGDSNDTVYLLDEPGSYLHPAAQEKLCAKLKAISSKHGKVIFCTHSHHLLDPEQIPLNSILIVSKAANKSISLTALPLCPTSREKLTALQPVFEALQMASAEFTQDDLPVVAVEGIYDKYSINMFLPKANQVRIYPGTSADSILKNIQTLNAFGRVYVALWDNDPEGRKMRRRAESLFGTDEARRFDLLPSRDNGKDRTMEQMFDSTDLRAIGEALKLPSNASYESIIAGLYYAHATTRKGLISKVSDATKANFEVLQKIIDKRLEESRELRKAE